VKAAVEEADPRQGLPKLFHAAFEYQGFVPTSGLKIHRLLAYLSQAVTRWEGFAGNATIVDCVSGMGESALALQSGTQVTVHSFDKENGASFNVAMLNGLESEDALYSGVPRIKWHTGDLLGSTANKQLLLKSRLIFLRLNDAVSFTRPLLKMLWDKCFAGLVVLDATATTESREIYSWMQTQGFQMHDVTDVGSVEGTTLVSFVSDVKIALGSQGDEIEYRPTPVELHLKPFGAEAHARVPCVPHQSSDFMLDTLEYLPPAGTRGIDNDWRAFQEELSVRQLLTTKSGEAQACRGDEERVTASWSTYGFGANLHLLMRQMTQAYDNGKVFDISSMYFNMTRCPSLPTFCSSALLRCTHAASIFCFIAPLTGTCKNNMNGKNGKSNGLLIDSAPPLSTAQYVRGYVPPKWARKGFFWWTASQVKFLLKFQESLTQEAEKIKREIGYAHPILGMQIRRGDSCFVRVHCYGLDVYVERAARMASKYGIRRIFLATDSALVLEQTRRYPQFTWVWQSTNRSVFDLPQTMRELAPHDRTIDYAHSSGIMDEVDNMHTMALDLLLLGEADAFVGGFTTGVARAAYELMASTKGCHPPFASVDVPWCHNNGAKMGRRHLNESLNMDWADTSC
jgi:hypothetical protein